MVWLFLLQIESVCHFNASFTLNLTFDMFKVDCNVVLSYIFIHVSVKLSKLFQTKMRLKNNIHKQHTYIDVTTGS